MYYYLLIASLAVASQAHAGKMDAMPETANNMLFNKALEQAELGKFKASLATLEKLEPSADVYTMMAYNTRKLKKYEEAFALYRKALEINPHHIQALEYYGEGLLEVGKIDKARKHLATLKEACGQVCRQYRTLKDLIEEKTGAKAAKPRGKW